jgi:hypothetical protein
LFRTADCLRSPTRTAVTLFAAMQSNLASAF